MARVQTLAWPPGQLTTSELANEREELEHKLSDAAFTTAEARERWDKRLTAIKAEQSERAEARRKSRP